MFSHEFSIHWDGKTGFVVRGGEGYRLDRPVTASFAYDELYADQTRAELVLDGKRSELNDAQAQEIAGFVESVSNRKFPFAHCIDARGRYLGKVNPNSPEVAGIVRGTPPNEGNWYWNENEWQLIMGVDETGQWVRKATFDTIAEQVLEPPPEDYFRWDSVGQEWVDARPVDVLLDVARKRIDEISSMLRQRPSNVLCTQDAVDIEKLRQAKEVVSAGYVIDPVEHDFVDAVVRAQPWLDENTALDNLLEQLTLARKRWCLIEEARIAALSALDDTQNPADIFAAVSLIERFAFDKSMLRDC